MSLSSTQQEFTYHIAQLIAYSQLLDYGLTFGDAYRDEETRSRRGHPDSNHGRRLAVDFNLFIDGEYQTSSEAHAPLGHMWKSLHPDNVWGGDFDKPDGNHYSRRYKDYTV